MARMSLRSRIAAICGAVIVVVVVIVVAVSCSGHLSGTKSIQDHRASSEPPVSSAPPAVPQSPGTGTGSSPGTEQYRMTSGGVQRTYRVYRPVGLPANAPLVVMLHGGGGSGAVAEQYYGWDAEADKEKFVVAYPDGLGPNEPAWNTGGGCCGYPARQNVDDVGFIRDMITAIESRTSIDAARIYAAGISNGGIMAYTLACQTDLFAAIGPDSATMLGPCDAPSPTSVIHVHGLQDTTIPFAGGVGSGPAAIDGPAVTDVIDEWRRIDRCMPPTSTTAGVVTTSLSVCADSRSVELITIADGGHGWPGSPVKAGRSTAGGNQPSDALNATDVMWRFFAAHPKP